MADKMLIDGLIKFCDEKSKNIKLKAEPQVFVEIAKQLETLKLYKVAEEQGMIVKLPCNVGDIVYVLEPCHCYNNYKENQNCHHTKTKATKFIDVVRVTKKYNSRSNTNCMKLYERHFKMDYLTKIGKTVFLTQEEAEQALEQMKAGGKNERDII